MGDELERDETPLTEEEVKSALQRAVCVCGHRLQEHGPVWCRALACECRSYRSAQGAS